MHTILTVNVCILEVTSTGNSKLNVKSKFIFEVLSNEIEVSDSITKWTDNIFFYKHSYEILPSTTSLSALKSQCCTLLLNVKIKPNYCFI